MSNDITVYNVERRRGDDFAFVINLTDENDVAIPLTTETFILSISSVEAPTGAPDIYTIAGSITDVPTAEITFALSAAIDVGNYFYDVEQTNPDTTTRTIMVGKWDVIQDITK